MKLGKIMMSMAAIGMCFAVTPRAMAECGDGVLGVTCNEYLGVGKKESALPHLDPDETFLERGRRTDEPRFRARSVVNRAQ